MSSMSEEILKEPQMASIDDAMEKSETKEPDFNPEEEKVLEIITTPSGNQFLQILEATGKIHKEQILATEEESKKFIADYHAWVRAGRPTPKMPEVKRYDKRPIEIIKVIDRGEQKLVVNYDDGTRDGIVERPKYSVVEDLVTGKKTKSTRPHQVDIEYTMPWSAAAVRRYVESAKKLTPADKTWMLLTKEGDRYVQSDTLNEFLGA